MKKTVSVIFTDDQIMKLEKDAETNGRLLSSHIRFIVQKYLEQLDRNEDFSNEPHK